MITGYATLKRTNEYLDRHSISKRQTPWFATSPVAIGTHLGNRELSDSLLYRASIEHGLKNGINFVDTAINYRGMRSERDIGLILTKLIRIEKILTRDEVVISSKAGIIPGDVEAGLVPMDYLKHVLLDGGIITESDLNQLAHQGTCWLHLILNLLLNKVKSISI